MVYTKRQAGYKLNVNRKKCKHCRYFKPKIKKCSYVEGEIKPNATCRYWRGKNG